MLELNCPGFIQRQAVDVALDAWAVEVDPETRLQRGFWKTEQEFFELGGGLSWI